MNRRLLVLAALAVMTVAAPAEAAEVSTGRGCYADPGTRRDTVTWSATGLAPGGALALALDGRALAGAGATADAGGAASGSFPSPSLNATVAAGTLEHTFTLTASDGTNAPAAQFTVSKLRASFRPTSGNPRTLRVRFAIHGFGLAGAQSPPIYVHYVRPNGRVRTTVRLGTGAGACGSLTTSRRRLFPFRPSTGRWTLQFDTAKKYVRPGPRSTFLFYRVPVRIN